MNKWVLLQHGERPPALAPEQFICLAMTQGRILRVMYRFVKNIKGNIAGYMIEDATTRAPRHAQLRHLLTSHAMLRVNS